MCCVHLVYKAAREIRKFHVVVVLCRLRNEQNSVRCTCKVLVLLPKLIAFFAVLVALAVVVA